MQNVEFPEVKERMETKVCCAHNVTRGCAISAKVDVVDLALYPLKALKMLMDGLALDGVSGLWLRSLLGPPRMMHLFPFDFVYLDEDLRIIEGIELFPNAPFPACEATVASALILPLRTLASTGTQNGDQLLICAPGDLEARLAEIAAAARPVDIAIPPSMLAAEATEIPANTDSLRISDSVPTGVTGFDQRVPIPASTVSPGAGFTVSLATTWQVTRTTIPTVVSSEEPGSTSPPLVESSAAEFESAGHATPEVLTQPEVVLSPPQMPAQAGAAVPASLEPQTAISIPEASPSSDLIDDRLAEAIATAEAAETVAPANAEEQIAEERIARSREAWEKAQVKPQQAPVSTPPKPRKKPREPKKDPLGTRVIRWLNLEDPPPERRKIIRLRLEGLQAYAVHDDQQRRYDIRDICPTGFCLRGRVGWRPGRLVSLIIEKKGVTERRHQDHVRVQARVVRSEEDGMGMEFVFPKGTEFHPWQRVRTKRSDETEAAFILRELRFSNALGFLRRLCPGAAEQLRHAFEERLSNKRVASAVEIVLLAEEALALHGQVDLARAHNEMVMRIVESGSWTEDEWIRKLWAGLLVSACSPDGQDTSNQPFIDLLAKLTPLHLRVLSFVCGKAAEAIAEGHSPKEFCLECTAEELMEASDWHSFARIQQTVGHLSGYGLFAESARPSYVTLADKSRMRLAPTALGLKMWARCNGQCL